jgi:hypothetical protein
VQQIVDVLVEQDWDAWSVSYETDEHGELTLGVQNFPTAAEAYRFARDLEEYGVGKALRQLYGWPPINKVRKLQFAPNGSRGWTVTIGGHVTSPDTKLNEYVEDTAEFSTRWEAMLFIYRFIADGYGLGEQQMNLFEGDAQLGIGVE